MINVTLDENDIRVASNVAYNRGLTSILAGVRNVNGGAEDPFLRHVVGAMGECAVAKGLDIYWDGSVGRFRGMGNDVGTFQVRARREELPMIIRPSDNDDDIFIAVYMTDKTYRNWVIAGWIRGRDGKQVGHLVGMQGGQRYQVPIEKLCSTDGLLEPA